MRQLNHLHSVYADASADPRLHGIARGLGLLFPIEEAAEMPDMLDGLAALLDRRDDWDGPDRDTDL